MFRKLEIEGHTVILGSGNFFYGGEVSLSISEIENLPDEVIGSLVRAALPRFGLLRAEYRVDYLDHHCFSKQHIYRLEDDELEEYLEELSPFAGQWDQFDEWIEKLTTERDRREVKRQKQERAARRKAQRDGCVPGFVYIIRHQNAFKIGKSNNPDRRIRQELSPKLPHDVKVVCILETTNMSRLEASLHEQFADRRLNGEWFSLTDDDLSTIMAGRGIR